MRKTEERGSERAICVHQGEENEKDRWRKKERKAKKVEERRKQG